MRTDFDPRRPELNQTVIFGETPEADKLAIVTRNLRLVPGPEFSGGEFEKLWDIAGNDSLNSPIVTPTQKQLSRIALNQVKGCWELHTYQDTKNRARYGRLSVKNLHNTSSLAHRTMYMVFYGQGSLPNGRHDYLDHLCENKPCCYPRHLEVVTHATNTWRGRQVLSPGQLSIDYS